MTLMGAFSSITGALLPAIIRDLRLLDSQAGLLVSSPAIGYVLASGLAGIMGDYLGFRRVWLLGIIVGLIAVAGIALSPTFPWLLIFAGIMGTVGGFFDGSINPLVSVEAGDRAGGVLNQVHLFFGLGATVFPLLVGLGLRLGLFWRWHYALLSLYLVALGVILWTASISSARAKRRPDGSPSRRSVVLSRLVLLSSLTILLYCGVESSVFSWIAVYMERVRSADLATASLGVSVFGGTMTLGRLICGQIAERLGYRRLVIGGSWLGAVALRLMMALPGPVLPWLGLALGGLAISGIFATLMADVTRKVAAHKGTVSGMICSSCGMGMILFPWLLGQVTEATNVSVGMGLTVALGVAAGVVYLLT